MHKNTQMYERLGSKYRLAIDLRILGYTYNRIAVNPQINLKENTVRSWFTQKGICYQGYKELQEQRINEREDLFKNISIQLLDLAYDAVSVLAEAVKKKNLSACLKIIEIAGIDSNLIQRLTKPEDSETLRLFRSIIDRQEKIIKKQKISLTDENS